MKKSIHVWVAILMMLTGLVYAGGSKEPTPSTQGEKKEKLMVYTSMKEVLIGELRDAFVKKHPNISFDYYSAGAGKIMAKIAAERQSKQLVCDVIWTSEIPDFISMKNEGILEPYISPEAQYIVSPLPTSAEYTPARLGTLGITYNTNKVKNPPKNWQDLLKPEWKDGFAFANPALSGTAMVSIGLIVNTFGWEFIEKLKANGARMGQGSGQVVDDTASGDLLGCLGVDYITIDKIKKGAPLAIVFPPEMLVIPSPVAIFRGTPNLSAAKKFVDFLLSKEGQTIIAKNYTLPSRPDIPILKDVGLVDPKDAVARAMKVDYIKLMAEKQAVIDKFQQIMQKK